MKLLQAFLILLALHLHASEYEDSNLTTDSTIWSTVKSDYSNFYSIDRMTRLGIGFGVGAVVANTNIDQNVQDGYQEHIRSDKTDKFSKVAKIFGEGTIMIPTALLCSSIDYIYPNSALSTWGKYTSRAYLTGAPALLLMQQVTGASRPDEKPFRSSNWHSFQDDNGVSGHAFMGAIPFLTLANMYHDNPYIKYLAYTASFVTAYSRLNDNKHYLSQISLGWYMAYETVDAVFHSKEKSNVTVVPVVGNNYYGFLVGTKW